MPDNFPLFGRLPPELRLAIWSCYALPKGPMAHVISDRWVRRSTITNNHSKGVKITSFNGHSLIHPDTLYAARQLMQVNKEARTEVLQGRQLQRIRDGNNNRFSAKFYYGNHQVSWGGGVCRLLHNYFFVNWDLDLFHFQSGWHFSMHDIFDDASLQRITSIAMDVLYPKQDGEEVHAPRYEGLYEDRRLMPFPVMAMEGLNRVRQNLRSVHRLALILPYDALRQMNRPPPNGDETDDDDESDTSSSYGTGSDFYTKDEDFLDLIDYLETNEFGLHPINTHANAYWDDLLKYKTQREVEVEITFPTWANKVLAAARRDVQNFCGRLVDVEMAMDHKGYFEPEIDGYHRLWVGFEYYGVREIDIDNCRRNGTLFDQRGSAQVFQIRTRDIQGNPLPGRRQ